MRASLRKVMTVVAIGVLCAVLLTLGLFALVEYVGPEAEQPQRYDDVGVPVPVR